MVNNLGRQVDPGSPRLRPAQIIEIHRAHRAGESWHSIARRFGTAWKNISRIINGDRWAELHPSRRPDLYAETREIDPILRDLDEIERRVKAIRAVIGQPSRQIK